MPSRIIIGVGAFALMLAACSSSPAALPEHATPEGAVVSWFDAVDSGDVETASATIQPESLALIMGIENDISTAELSEYLSRGVPLDLQKSYWKSFSEGFTEFADKTLSSLTVGQADEFVSEGETFASVPVTGGPASGSVIIVRQRLDGSWEVDMVASLGDGFSKLLLDRYERLGAGEDESRIRLAYLEVVEPSLWAAMADGSFGDDFARTALTLLSRIDADNA